MKPKLKIIGDARREPWYGLGLKFGCTGCGNCCTGGPGFVWISEGEIARLAEHLGIGVGETIERYCRKVGGQYSLNENCNERGEYDCVFLREQAAGGGGGDKVVHGKRVCLVYGVRPLQCRTWPFWTGPMASAEDWARAGRRCAGIDGGRRYTREEMEGLRDARDWPK